MKKVLFISMICTLLFSCKKETKSQTEEKTTTGTLRYYTPVGLEDPLKYETDGAATLLFDDFHTGYDYYISWQNSLNVHTRLTYTETGKTGCDLNYQIKPCDYPQQVVHVVKIEKD